MFSEQQLCHRDQKSPRGITESARPIWRKTTFWYLAECVANKNRFLRELNVVVVDDILYQGSSLIVYDLEKGHVQKQEKNGYVIFFPYTINSEETTRLCV